MRKFLVGWEFVTNDSNEINYREGNNKLFESDNLEDALKFLDTLSKIEMGELKEYDYSDNVAEYFINEVEIDEDGDIIDEDITNYRLKEGKKKIN